MIDAAVETLFRRFRSHSDASALAAVFDRVAPELARVAGYLARGDAQLAADLLQATWLGAIERAASWDDGRPLLPWLLGILANQARSQRRALDRLRTGPDAEALTALLASDDPLRASADGEFARCLAAAMAGLAPPFREVVLLHVQHGLTAKDIGAALGRPAGTVRTQIVRGLDRLRTLLPAGLATAGAVTVGLSAAEMAQLRQQVLAAAPPPAVASASPSGVAAGVALAVVAVVAVGWLWGREEPTVPTPDPAPLVTAAAPTSAAAPEPGERMAVVAPAAVAPPATQPRRRLTVHVRRDEAPAVVPGELVALVSSEGHERLAPTNAAGDAVFDDVAPAGLWWIHLNGAAATATASTGRLPPRDTFDLEVELPVRDGRPLRVRVVDAAGLPVADAEVQGNALEGRLRYGWLPRGRTAADGVLRLRNQRLARYRARAAGHAPAGESVPRATDGEPEVGLQVGAPAGPWRWQVLDVEGAPS
ncbi:MAG: RNA polymerase sigma factor, partial [Planctomycetota bacterium]